MKNTVLFLLVVVAIAAQIRLTATQQCEADYCGGTCFGRSNNYVNQATDWMSMGINCTMCQLDCMQPGVTPFESCPCRYYRYGCLKENYCTSLDGLTRRQYDGAVFLCKSMGCAFKKDIIYSGNPDNKLYTEYGVNRIQSWIDVRNKCAWPGASNAEGYKLRRDAVDCIRGQGKCTEQPLKFVQCEREYYRNATIAKINSLIANDRRPLNPALYQQIRSEQYRNYFIQMIDIPGTFFTYFAASAEILAKREKADFSAFNTRMVENSNAAISTRWTLFKIRPIEVSNLINQYEICSALGATYPTRGEAIAGLIENYIHERRALDKGFTLLEFNDAQWEKLDVAYFKTYVDILTSFGVDINKYNTGADQAREVAYPLLFPTVSASAKVRRDNVDTVLNVKYSPAEYFERIPKSGMVDYFDNKGSLCPSYNIKIRDKLY